MSDFLPIAFQNQMQQILQDEYLTFVDALQTVSPTSIRLNPRKKTNVLHDDAVKWCDDAFYLNTRPIFTLDPLFHAGAYYVQEASSMFIAEAIRQTVDLSKSLKVLDLCAAPGGKTTLLASLLNEDSVLVANEVIKSRVGILKENLEKWGYSNYIVSNHDTEDLANLEGFFDVVLIDAPCSGEGLFRKDPKAISEWSEANVQLCSARQKRILQAAAHLVAPSGILLYSTCTYNEQENQNNARWLTQLLDFEQISLNIPAEWQITERGGGYQFFPHKTKGEGFFLSVFRREKGHNEIFTGKIRLNRVRKRHMEIIRKWIKEPDKHEFFLKADETIVALPEGLQNEYAMILKSIEKRSSGIEIGTFKGEDFIPSHALALSTMISDDIPAIELSKEDALRFLKKENLTIENAPNGWLLARFEGLNLGWMKVIGNRTNNYLPKDWRIRMEIE